MVLNPAVLGVMALKKVVVTFPNQVSCNNKVFWYSDIAKNTNPPTINAKVVYKTILVFNVVM